MRIELFKGNNIKTKDEYVNWLSIVESIEMSKDIVDIAAQYCNYHAAVESKQFKNVEIGEIVSLLPISLNVLRKIDFSKIEKIFISDNADVNLHSVKIGIDELNSLRHGGTSDLLIEDILGDMIATEVSKTINKQIENSKDKTLEIGILVCSIHTMADHKYDATCLDPKIVVKSCFKVY